MKKIKITNKLLIPVIISILSGVLFLFLFVYKVTIIEKKIHYLDDMLVPGVEKSANNLMKLKSISEKFVFAVLASELDMLPSSNVADSVENNLKIIVKNTNYTDSIRLFSEYFKLSMAHAKHSIVYPGISENTLDSKDLLNSYNQVKKRFEDIHLYFKNKIVSTTKNIHIIVNEVIYFTILYIVLSSLFILGVSYIIYKDFNDKFLILKNELRKFNLLINNDENAMLDADELTLLSQNVKKQIKRFKNLKNEKRNIESIVNKDHLTGLYNRRYLHYLQNELKQSNQSFSVIMIDIDHFKNINDTYGHTIGDDVLIEFSNILKNSVRDDDVVVRYGGEEFIIIMKIVQKGILFRNAERIRNKIEKFTFSKIGNITASFGIAYDDRDHNINEVIKNADTALYEAKENGRNQVVFYKM